MKRKMVEELLKNQNINVFGFCDTNYEDELIERLQNRKINGYCSEFEYKILEKRLSANAINEKYIQTIVIAVPYNVVNMHTMGACDKGYGKITNMAWEYDYHKVVKEKLNGLCEELKEECPDLEYECLVDTSPLVDRHVGYKADIGKFGYNSSLINEKLGSGFYIGIILMNKQVEDAVNAETEKNKFKLICESCQQCIKKCPAYALGYGYKLDASKCISELTQSKRVLTEEEMSLIGNRLYGCDICYEVCPYNMKERNIPEEFIRNSKNIIELKEIINMSNREFKKKYGNTGFGWRGLKVLKRNAIIVAGNECIAELEGDIKAVSEANEDLQKYCARYADKIKKMSKKRGISTF